MFCGEAMRAGPRNNKLECFLKRSLTEERYERLRAYDSCIVDRKWRYLVLGDRCIYLTENPPRTLRKAILYRDLKAAQLVRIIKAVNLNVLFLGDKNLLLN